MSVSKALQFMDKKDLECAICLNRFHQPKTLKCMHTYCLQCIQKWVETHGKMKCPTCGQEHDLTKADLQQLTSNTMITQLLEYVIKTEDQKPTKCSVCDNEPAYHCSMCQLYLCDGNCIKQHKILPSTKDHPLYKLNIKEQDGKPTNCPVHRNTTLEFYCTTCNKSACKQCDHIFDCLQKHKVIPMSTAVDTFNKEANEVVKLAFEFEDKLTKKIETITKDASEFESQLKLCRSAIEIQEKNLIMKVQAKSQQLTSELESMYKEEKENFDSEVNDIDSKMTQVKHLIVSTNKMMNKPEEIQNLRSHNKTINVLRTEFDKSFHKKINTPNFIPYTHLDELMNTEGIGRISTADSMMYKVAEKDEAIRVTKREPNIVVKVSTLAVTDACQLAAMLTSSSGEESATEIKHQGNGEYKITGRCNVEGEWQMKITVGATNIKESPVNNKVETLGLVHTIDNISDYKEHNKAEKVTDVALDRDGCILVSSNSKDILKVNQSGLFVSKIPLTYMYKWKGFVTSYDIIITRMHQMGDGHILYSAYNSYLNTRTVMIYDDTGKHVKTIQKDNPHGYEYPIGLTADKESRVLYVTDRYDHCVYKFNVDDGSQLSTIGSKGSEVGQMKEPHDVTLTKEGHVIVADFGNNRIQMFDANGMLMRVCIIGCGEEDGKVIGPHGLAVDTDGNIIVSSNHKLQLFDKNGVFIKRIDHEDDGLNIPLGISVISNRPRIVAVANHGANNVKLFKY